MTTRKDNSRGIDRRTLLKISAATSAMAAAGVYAPAVHAQARPIKIGYVSPATGPLAAFAAADEFMLGQFRQATRNGLRVGNTTRPIQIILKDSQSNPNRAARHLGFHRRPLQDRALPAAAAIDRHRRGQAARVWGEEARRLGSARHRRKPRRPRISAE